MAMSHGLCANGLLAVITNRNYGFGMFFCLSAKNWLKPWISLISRMPVIWQACRILVLNKWSRRSQLFKMSFDSEVWNDLKSKTFPNSD